MAEDICNYCHFHSLVDQARRHRADLIVEIAPNATDRFPDGVFVVLNKTWKVFLEDLPRQCCCVDQVQ